MCPFSLLATKGLHHIAVPNFHTDNVTVWIQHIWFNKGLFSFKFKLLIKSWCPLSTTLVTMCRIQITLLVIARNLCKLNKTNRSFMMMVVSDWMELWTFYLSAKSRLNLLATIFFVCHYRSTNIVCLDSKKSFLTKGFEFCPFYR